jgi:putative transcriptional regulator
VEWNKDTIKKLRKRLGLTQSQFAELLGTAQELISQWENEKRFPSGVSRRLLTLVAEKEGVDLEELEKISASDLDIRKKQDRH